MAGSSTAMMLARRGLKVLILDRAEFPSDMLSTHIAQLPGVAALERWEVLGKVVETNAPPVRKVAFDVGDLVLQGRFPVRGARRRQDEADRFFELLTGAVPYRDFFAPGHLLKLLGRGCMAKVMSSPIARPKAVAPPQLAEMAGASR